MAKRPLHIPTIETARLLLAPLSFDHSNMMFCLWSHPDICRFAGPVRDHEGRLLPMPAPNAEISDKIIEFWHHAARKGWGFRWAAIECSSGTAIGLLGFNALGNTSEIAYFLDPAHWGSGFMTEAAGAALKWRLSQGNCTELEAFIAPGNVKSIALAERLGFCTTSTISDGARRYLKVSKIGASFS